MIEAILEFLLIFENFLTARKKKSMEKSKPTKHTPKRWLMKYFLVFVIVLVVCCIAYNLIFC